MSQILIVDDDPVNLHIIADYLSGHNYQFTFATDGQTAWELLSAQGRQFDLVILDRMMPRLDGMQILKLIKTNPRLVNLPVIMQTSSNAPSEIAEGLATGAWYYLAKPYRRDALKHIVASALEDRKQRIDIIRLGAEMSDVLDMMEHAKFRFRTLEQVQTLAITLARNCPNESMVAIGLLELMLNAVEHGNLEISYQDKGRLIENDAWQGEINYRLSLPKFASRYAEIEFIRTEQTIQFTISDAGKGFAWQDYIDFDVKRAYDCHGRGIAMARQLSFNQVEFLGCGNQVTATVIF